MGARIHFRAPHLSTGQHSECEVVPGFGPNPHPANYEGGYTPVVRHKNKTKVRLAGRQEIESLTLIFPSRHRPAHRENVHVPPSSGFHFPIPSKPGRQVPFDRESVRGWRSDKRSTVRLKHFKQTWRKNRRRLWEMVFCRRRMKAESNFNQKYLHPIFLSAGPTNRIFLIVRRRAPEQGEAALIVFRVSFYKTFAAAGCAIDKRTGNSPLQNIPWLFS